MPVGSVVELDYDGTNIINYILPGSARFESQLNAVPGTFEFVAKDVAHTLGFVTGKEVALIVDGVKLYGGYVMVVGRTYPFSAMDTVNTLPADTARYWRVQGVDYNILFDKRVLRNPTEYLKQIPNFASTTDDGVLIRQMWADYIDTPSGFDTDTFVDDIQPPFNNGRPTGAWNTQGDKARAQMESFTQFTGACWYFDADKNLHHHAIEDTVMRWGFSDNPNKNAITASPATYQDATIGMREVNAIESGDHMVNDALIWGGSPFGTNAVVFSREENSGSITAHNRWQLAELHFGEQGYGVQDGVDARSDIIVNGSPGAVGADQQRGLRYPQWQFKLVWYAHLVPKISGVPDHIHPGYLATITLETFEESGDPLVQLLPLRSLTITFPSLDPSGNGYVHFEGRFGLQPDDPFSLWRFLLRQGPKITSPVATVDDASDSTSYGAYATLTPTPTPDGSSSVFTQAFGYIAQTTQVYLFPSGGDGGLLKRRDVDYTESDPENGEITWIGTLPATGDVLVIYSRTLSA